LLENDVVKEISKTSGQTAAQVLMRWSLQHGAITIPKTSNADRLEQMIGALEFELTSDQMEQLNLLNDPTRGAQASIDAHLKVIGHEKETGTSKPT